MQQESHYVISIAGFDPSAGAGILADIKTFERLNVYGLGVCSAITIQTGDMFKDVQWIPAGKILEQLNLLMRNYPVHFIKVGLIESLDVLKEILSYLKYQFPEVKIIWDPILKASAGYQFHHSIDTALVHELCKDIFLITPNIEEAMALTETNDPMLSARKLHAATNIFLKSVHLENGFSGDVLFENGNEYFFTTEFVEGFEKHGSGCVLAAAITAFLAKGNDLEKSCENGKKYTAQFLKSTNHLLGNHWNIKMEKQHE